MNWITRFILAIATHKADASAHHAKTTTAAEITSGRFPVDRLPAMTDEKIWKGTGGNVEEVDAYTDAKAVDAVGAAGLALASGKKIEITSILTDNDTCTGIIAIFTSGAIMNLGEVGYLKTADSRIWKALATGTATMPAIALAYAVPITPASCLYLLLGFMRHDAWDWTPGGLLYVDRTTAGALTQTAPSTSGDQVQVEGIAITADIILFNPSYELVEIS